MFQVLKVVMKHAKNGKIQKPWLKHDGSFKPDKHTGVFSLLAECSQITGVFHEIRGHQDTPQKALVSLYYIIISFP